MAGQAVEKADDLHETALEHTLMQPPSPREEQRFDAEGYKPNRDAQWIPDEERDCCVVCTKSFTLITRRHHCRFCYEVVCGRCSRARSWYHGTLQMERQCDKCASELGEAELRGADAGELKILLGKGRAKRGMFEGDLEQGELEIGQVVAQFEDIPSAGEVMTSLIAEYEQVRTELVESASFNF